MPGWAPNSSVSWLPVGLGELPPLVCMEENNHSRTLETYPEDRAHGALVSHWASPRSQVLPRGGVWWCPHCPAQTKGPTNSGSHCPSRWQRPAPQKTEVTFQNREDHGQHHSKHYDPHLQGEGSPGSCTYIQAHKIILHDCVSRKKD